MYNSIVLSGPQLFLRFAWPCADYRLALGKITESQFVNLKLLVDQVREPSISFLGVCFPVATEALLRFALSRGPDNHDLMWRKETVFQFWRAHTGRTPDCAVMQAVVDLILNGLVPRVMLTNGMLTFNPYGLKLEKGYKVLVHRSVIVTHDCLPVG